MEDLYSCVEAAFEKFKKNESMLGFRSILLFFFFLRPTIN